MEEVAETVFLNLVDQRSELLTLMLANLKWEVFRSVDVPLGFIADFSLFVVRLGKKPVSRSTKFSAPSAV